MTDPRLTLDATIARADTVIASDLADESVVVDADRLRYHGLNETGSRIWGLISEPTTVRELCARLADEFDVPTERCEEDVIAFLGDLSQRGVISIVEA
ncbi:MAG: PqqD family peptide modification chaperone [Gemmatimonadetes bacterium]|nr:PqqD family peptide modification chaperone [Gemmatimonadota bacterium]